jgi:transcriptional regulator with XRE-family HTH domain
LVNDRSPTSRGRELARQLRDLRKSAGLSVEDVARQVQLSPSRISGIETVSPAASSQEVSSLGGLYRVDGQQLIQLLELTREAADKGWWEEYEDLGIGRLIGLEVEASQISSYEQSVIPWMLQTEEYARAVIKGILPGITDRVLNQRVEARLKRQELLTRDPHPNFWSLVDESALRRSVGGNQVMRDQLRKILEVVATVPSITLQIVPLSLDAHPGLDNTFTLLEFESSQPAMVYVENLVGALYLDRPFDVDKYRDALKYLQARALDPDSSGQLVKDLEAGDFADFRAAAHPGNW